MRAHLAVGPRAPRAPITVFVPHGHPMHRASSVHRQSGDASASARGNRQAATAAALVCALGLLSAVLLGGIGREASPSPAVLPWQSVVPAPLAVTVGAPPMLPAPSLPAAPVLTGPVIALPVPHFTHLPYRIR